MPRLLPDRVAPQIQPSVRFLEHVPHQPVGDVPRQAEKTCALQGVNALVPAGLPEQLATQPNRVYSSFLVEGSKE